METQYLRPGNGNGKENKMTWTFYLNITNNTDRDLEVLSSQLYWGYWNTNGQEDKGPQIIHSGRSVQAVGVKAAAGPNGYEFSCSWKDKNKANELPYGVISLYVDVPHRSSNKASCTSNGLLSVDGWEVFPEGGHNFVRNITISNKLQERVNSGSEELEWFKIRHLEEIEDLRTLDVNDYIPKGLNFEKQKVCRTPVFHIPERLWDAIEDPDFNSMYAKEQSVNQYFSVAITCLQADAENVVTVSRGSKRNVKYEFTTRSKSKKVEETVLSIESSLRFKKNLSVTTKVPIGEASTSTELEANLKTKFDLKIFREDEEERQRKETKEDLIEAPVNKDLEVVPWTNSKMVLLYRTDKKNVTTLIGASEWVINHILRSYERDAMIGTKEGN